VAREVTLLPRHWDWLAEQPGGASAALRRLIEAARRSASGERRRAQTSLYRFMTTMAGDAAGYERIVLLFDGDDPDALDAARARWSAAKAAGADVTYWQSDENGRWRRQA